MPKFLLDIVYWFWLWINKNRFVSNSGPDPATHRIDLIRNISKDSEKLDQALIFNQITPDSYTQESAQSYVLLASNTKREFVFWPGESKK